MKGIYQSRPDCNTCMEFDWAPPEACHECLKLMRERAEKVDILQLGVGFFANKAIIKKSDGTLATVSLSELTITD